MEYELEKQSHKGDFKWAEELAEMLKLWCDENGFEVRTMFAREIGLPTHAWQTLLSGRSYTNPEIYAKIFVKTGLSEADPRTLPPRTRFIPSTKKLIDMPRAWTEEQFELWKKDEKTASLGKKKPYVQAVAPLTKPSHKFKEFHSIRNQAIQVKPEDDPLGKIFRELVTQIAREMAPALAAEISSSLQASFIASAVIKPEQPLSERRTSPISRSIEIENGFSKLYKTFVRLMNSSTEERTLFANTYAQEITDLMPYINEFARPDETKRERGLAGIQHMEMKGLR